MILTEEEQKELLVRANSDKGTLNIDDGVDCQICNNKGYVFVFDKFSRMVAKDCECSPQRHIAIMLKESGLSRRYFENTLENFITHEKWQVAMKSFVEKYLIELKDDWLVLSGQVGSGKTHLAVAVLKELAKRGKKVKYLNFSRDYKQLVKFRNSGIPEVQEKAQREYDTLCNSEILFIDDFLKNVDNVEETFDLIDYRYANNLVTIITTEYSYKDMFSKSEAVASRIKEMTNDTYWLDIEKDVKKNQRIQRGNKDD